MGARLAVIRLTIQGHGTRDYYDDERLGELRDVTNPGRVIDYPRLAELRFEGKVQVVQVVADRVNF